MMRTDAGPTEAAGSETDEGLKNLRPEWVRIGAAVKLFGLSRSKLYELITGKRIKSFTLRERNKIKGIRLINYDSLCQFLESEAKAAQEEIPA